MKQKAKVAYQIATYQGDLTVYCKSYDDDEVIIEKAKKELAWRVGILPYGYQSFKVKSRKNMKDY